MVIIRFWVQFPHLFGPDVGESDTLIILKLWEYSVSLLMRSIDVPVLLL